MSTDATHEPEILLPNDLVVCQAMIQVLLKSLHEKDHELSGVRHQLDLLLRRLYGRKSEKLDPDQLLLFALHEEESSETSAPPSDPPAEPQEKSPRAGNKPRRSSLPPDLPRQQKIHDLPEAEKTCPCCQTRLEKIGEETSEQLEYIPASLLVIEHVRLKYACKGCQDHIVRAAKPAQPIDKGMPGPGLLAHILTSKYADHLPLYRQEGMLARHGVTLGRNTLCDWTAQCGELLSPLYRRMIELIKSSRFVQTDDTHVPVLDPKLSQTRTGRLWTYLGEDATFPLTVFDYTPNRTRDGPTEFLQGYQGYLVADAFSGYDGIFTGSSGSIVEVACWAHARRKFYDAKSSDVASSHHALALIGQLYDVERHAQATAEKQALGADEFFALRHTLRDERSRGTLTKIKDWLDERSKTALPKSPIGQAIGYALNQWDALCRFLEQGWLPIDNNASERAIKNVVIGRKNWLFAGSDHGGRTAAILFSFTVSCKRNHLDPFAYLRDILDRISTHPANDIDALLPHRWRPTP